MPIYQIEVSRTWTETGSITISAPDEGEARDMAMEAMIGDTADTDNILWYRSNMTIESQDVESCEMESPTTDSSTAMPQNDKG